MKLLTRLILFVLAPYSAALVVIEWSTSQDYVRHFVTDIEGPVPFHAVNTTLSVFLMWGAALLFAVCCHCVREEGAPRRLFWFFASQAAVFAYLGCDDRFKLHEAVARRLGIGDHYVLLAVAAAEIALLATLGRELIRGAAARLLAAAAALFVVMMVIDAAVPHDLPLRLSLEDLCKTWANMFFLAFAWRLCDERIGRLKGLDVSKLRAAA